MTLVYCPHIQGDLAIPDAEEARHFLQVLRKRVGEEVFLTNGEGQGWRARISAIHRQEAHLQLEEPLPPRPDWGFHLHIGLAPPKQAARLEWFLEKVTELGVNRISLLATARSDRSHWRPDRLQRLLVAAMKQSGQFRLPLLDEGELRPASLYAEYADIPACRLIATCDWGNLQPLASVYHRENHVVFLIGPEGDFTPEEVREAGEARFQPVLLGPNRLRTETAGVAACAQIHVLHEKP
jgi:16S rRNA (uracil1498-N3)-methyltransferase